MMKKRWISGLVMMILLSGCSSDSKNTATLPNPEVNNSQLEQFSDEKVLIAYFSRVGNTDFPEDVDASTSASILRREDDLVGNTQYLAETIQQYTGGDLFLIQTVDSYPADYHETDMQGKDEKANQTVKQLANHLDNLETYDTIFLGYPNWYYDMPRAIYAFLDEYDLSGKTIIPFNTSGGSGFSDSISQIQDQEPNANVVTDGFTINHHKILDLDTTNVQEWLQSLQ